MDPKYGDERFDRHYRRLHLGLRLLTHGARAQTASEWSGLTPDRLTTLKRRWLPEAGDGFRGPAPTSFQPHFRSAMRAVHASLFTGIYQTLYQFGRRGGAPNELHPSLENGELLCEAYEVFLMWVEESDMEFDQAVLLARGVAISEVIELTRCPKCEGVVLIDKLARRKELCADCRRLPLD
jgi:hypothetical protein